MPKYDHMCSSIIFNRNILISGLKNRNILLYSIDIDSFSTIPYKFAENKRKILINAERLYLIEFYGSVYESQIGSDSNWRRIAESKMNYHVNQVYCSYNKGGINISTISGSISEYYYFNLDEKIIIDTAYYNEHISVRRIGQKIKAIKCNNQDFNPSCLDECDAKDITLKDLLFLLFIIQHPFILLSMKVKKFWKIYMMASKCFESGCMNEVEYPCKCSSPETLSCEVHTEKHAKLPNRAHNLESMFIQPCEGTKEAILEFLTKENSKYSELRRKIIDSLKKCPFSLKRNLRDLRKILDDCSSEINDFFAKISQVKKLSELEQDPILGLLVLQPEEAVEKVKLMTIANRDWYNSARFFYIINEKSASLNRSFIKEKYNAYLDNMNMQNASEVHNTTIEPAIIEPANVKDSNSLIINEINENLKGPENVKKPQKH